MGKLKYIPIIDTTYGKWKVIDDQVHKKPSNRSTYWKVQCECWKIELREAHHLVGRKTNSCRSCAAVKNSFEYNYYRRIKQGVKDRDIEFDISLEYILDLYEKQNRKCAYSNLDISFAKTWNRQEYSNQMTVSLDRINSENGYIKGNVQWVHKDINLMKWKFSEERFLELCRLIVNNLNSNDMLENNDPKPEQAIVPSEDNSSTEIR